MSQPRAIQPASMTSMSWTPDGLAFDGELPRYGARSRAPYAQQAAQLGQGLGRIVNADREVGEVLGGGHHHGSGLAAAPVAAGRFAAFQGREQPLGQRRGGIGVEAGQGGRGDLVVGEHVAGDADEGLADAAGPLDAVLAAPGRVTAMAIDAVKLADLTALIAGQGRGDGELGAEPPLQRVEHRRRKIAIGQRLGAHRADPRPHKRHERPGREGLGGHRRAKRAGIRVVGDDGPGHVAS